MARHDTDPREAAWEHERTAAHTTTPLPAYSDALDVPALPDAPPQIQTIPLSTRALHGNVWRLAWPSVLAMLLQTFNSLMDTFFVGHLPNGAQALAATGIGGSVQFLLVSLSMGVAVGTTALVARFTGAKDSDSAVRAAGQSLTLATLLGLLFGIAAYAGRDAMVDVLLNGRNNPEAARLCTEFLSAALLASVPLFVLNAIQGAFRGLGDTRTPLLITGGMIAVHISCNALLIYGNLGFPRLGVQGAGIALAASLYVGAGLFLLALSRQAVLKDAMRRRHLRLQWEWAERILRIGIPAAVQALIRTLSMMSFTGMLARAAEGAAGVAALQIGIRAEAIAFMPGFGYSVAASALVGQSLGAKDAERAERYGWAATAQAMGVMVGMAILFLACAVPITHLFTGDVLVQRLGADYLRINAVCEPFLALGMVLTGALQGAGDTVRPTYITIFTMWIIRIPLAWGLIFGLHLNAHGAWLSMTVTTIVGGLMTAWLFRSGRWKRLKV